MVARFAVALALLLSLTAPVSLAFGQGLGCIEPGIVGGGQICDRSTTITSGNTSQTALAANTKRIYCEIQPLAADAWIAINHTAAANTAGSFYVPANSLFRCPANNAPTGAINILSATAGASYTAIEIQR